MRDHPVCTPDFAIDAVTAAYGGLTLGIFLCGLVLLIVRIIRGRLPPLDEPTAIDRAMDRMARRKEPRRG